MCLMPGQSNLPLATRYSSCNSSSLLRSASLPPTIFASVISALQSALAPDFSTTSRHFTVSCFTKARASSTVAAPRLYPPPAPDHRPLLHDGARLVDRAAGRLGASLGDAGAKGGIGGELAD